MGGDGFAAPFPRFSKSVNEQIHVVFAVGCACAGACGYVRISPMPFRSLVCQSWDQPQIPSGSKCALH